MDVARSELNRLLHFINAHAWTLEDKYGMENHRYYFLDQSGTSPEGDTALHRILALHAPPAAIDNFLQHQSCHIRVLKSNDHHSVYDGLLQPSSMDAVNKAGANVLHVAVHRNSFHVNQVVQLLLSKCPELASMPMKCGSYPLHILAGHTITIPAGVLQSLLQVDPHVARMEDCHGDTPLSLLWKNVLRFRWARYWEVYGRVPDMSKTRDLSWMTVIAPEQFRDYGIQLLQAGRNGPLTWHHVCSTPRCPPLLIRLFLQQPQYLKSNFMEPDENGLLPLHHAAAAEPVSLQFVPDEVANHLTSVLDLVLQAAPAAAQVMDHSGRLPLHYALTRKVDASILPLLCACPEALMVQDPLTGLYPAQQLASQLENDKNVDIVYRMVRACPDVVNFHR